MVACGAGGSSFWDSVGDSALSDIVRCLNQNELLLDKARPLPCVCCVLEYDSLVGPSVKEMMVIICSHNRQSSNSPLPFGKIILAVK